MGRHVVAPRSRRVAVSLGIMATTHGALARRPARVGGGLSGALRSLSSRDYLPPAARRREAGTAGLEGGPALLAWLGPAAKRHPARSSRWRRLGDRARDRTMVLTTRTPAGRGLIPPKPFLADPRRTLCRLIGTDDEPCGAGLPTSQHRRFGPDRRGSWPATPSTGPRAFGWVCAAARRSGPAGSRRVRRARRRATGGGSTGGWSAAST